MDKISRFINTIHLKNKQKALNKKYKKEGLTEEILQEQIDINKKRHQHNIPDETEQIYKEFVQ